MDVFQTTRANLEKYRSIVEMPGGYDHDLVSVLRRIDCYYNGQFFESNRYEGGIRRNFFNITKPACDVATKFIDLDTKNILVYSTEAEQEWKVWLMSRDLKQWMKEKKFAEFLNDISFQLPKFGHFVCKKTKGGWKRVNLSNLRLDPATPTMEESPFVYEVNLMSVRDVREMEWDEEEVERLIAQNDSVSHVAIYECYELNKDSGEKKWHRSFRGGFLRKNTGNGSVSETPESQINNKDEYLPGVILFEDDLDELPYREIKWEEVSGRWLGQGFGEYLFDNQIRTNEIENTKSRGLSLAALKIFQTSDELIGRNVLTDMENGDIIKSSSGISQVDMTNHALSDFNEAENRWDMNTVQKTFTSDITRGEDLPSGTPLGVARISAAMVDSYYSIKRENIGLFIKRLLTEDVIPAFKKDRSKEHMLRFFGSDKEVGKLYRAIAESHTRQAMWEYALKTGIVPSQTELQLEQARIELSLKKRKDIMLSIPDFFYKDVEYALDVTVTGEEVDVNANAQALINLLQLVASNPTITQNPQTKAILFKSLELSGMSPADLDLIQDETNAAAPMPGSQPGGMAPMPAVQQGNPTRGEMTV